MAEVYLDVDTAVTVPVNRVPLVDDTDFKSIEEAVAFNAAGLEVIWNFVTSAGVQTATVITPTTAGVYDWSHVDGGIYKIEIPASGGVSANNDTEGYGWISGKATGVLPFAGPIIGFRAAALNDALCDGGDLLDVNLTQWLGTAAATPTVAGVPEVDVTHLLGTAWLAPGTAGTPDVNVKLWNALAAVALPLIPTTAGRSLDVSVGGEAGIDWANIGSPTTAVNLSATNIDADQVVASVSGAVGSVTGSVGSVTAGVTLAASAVQAIWDALTSALTTYDGPTNAEMEARTLVSASYATPTNITAGTITTVTNLTNAPTVGDLTAAMKASINTEVLDVIGTDTLVGGVTVKEALRRIGALTSGIVTGAGTGSETFKDYASSVNTIVITVDASGNRSAITYN